MKKYLRYLLALIVLAICAGAQAAPRFYNLTAREVSVTDAPPSFTRYFSLTGNYQDSVYTATIAYPEYIDMSAAEREKYEKLGVALPPESPEVQQSIVFDRKQPSLAVDFCPVVYREGRYRLLVSFMLRIEATPKSTFGKSVQLRETTTPAGRYAAHSVLASGRWVKIRVSTTGVHQLTSSLIRQAGFSNPDKVRIYGYGGNLRKEVLSEADIIEHDDLKEVPTCTVGGRRLFYARGSVSWDNGIRAERVRNNYSDYGYYFLTEGDDTPLSVDSAAFLQSFYPANEDYVSLHEVDGYAWFEGGRKLFDTEAVNVGASKSIVFKNPTGASAAQLRVNVTSGVTSQVRVSANGKDLGTLRVSVATGSNAFDEGGERGGAYTLQNIPENDTITFTVLSGGPMRLDYVQMSYDVPRPAPNLETAEFPVPEYVYAITNQDHHADPQADMVIIIPTSQKTLKQAQRLKAFHESRDGLRVNIVPADELYNEFSSGTPDASAYRLYMKMLYDRASTADDAPKYLLLFGNCVWDNRMLTTTCSSLNADDYLLCYESANSFNKVKCYIDDGFFCYLDDGEGSSPLIKDKLDVGVGRFPVCTEDDAKTMVDKTISYAENQNAGPWQNTLMFMGDDGNENMHMQDANEVATLVTDTYPNYLVKKVMWDSYTRETSSTGNTYPEATRVIKQQQAAGALIMDYAGHGKENQMSHERVLRLNDFANFSNTNLPLWISASCDIMPFDSPTENIGVTAVLNSKGGAVAFYGTTRTVYANYNTLMNKRFVRAILSRSDNNKPLTLGEAQRIAKNALERNSEEEAVNNLQYSLLGDPALALCLPTPAIVVDSINGTPATDTKMGTMRAGETVRLQGHVENGAAFSGIVTATVRDTEETITCRLNDTSEASTAFVYKDRTKTLYQGSDSVRAGKFDIIFAIPRDINYNDGCGLVNLYAYATVGDTMTTVNGHNDRFYVTGGDLAPNDSIGPSIYCYLNSPSFVDGGEVNATPYFVAEVTDKDGINAAGSGIGHDLQLIIDGKMAQTYNLNDNFAYDFGTYTRGTTYYNIPELEAGEHTLVFRAWDILNNMSQAELSFRVVRGIEPSFSISCTDNPAKTATTFVVAHDRVGSDIDVEIEVLDTRGRTLWRHEDNSTSSDSNYTYTWDLTASGGQHLETGVYLYRVKLTADGATKRSKAKKLIVINNK